MNNALSKFQELLRELFQFDCAELDFGICRIMNHKRDEVERFIRETLPKAVTEELDRSALAEQAQAAKELEEAKKKVLEVLSEDAMNAHAEQKEKTNVFFFVASRKDNDEEKQCQEKATTR